MKAADAASKKEEKRRIMLMAVKFKGKRTITAICFFVAGVILAGDHYVSPSGGYGANNPPYTNWADAATNIQDAVNSATNGETVWITNGTYFCQGVSTSVFGEGNSYTSAAMVVITNAITVRSVNGYSGTKVNGNWPVWTTRVFLVDHPGAMVSGLTITNGFVVTNFNRLTGAGVYLRCGLLTNCLITGNTISNNYMSLYGGGVGMETGVAANCIIRGNKGLGAFGGNGAGICLAGSGQIIKNCQIINNAARAGNAGSACYFYYSTATMTWCAVSSNIAGAGIALYYAKTCMVESCVISSNSWWGLDIENDRGSCFRNCLITKNNSKGLYADAAGDCIMENCSIVHNADWGILIPAQGPTYKYHFVNTISFYNGIGGTQNWSSTNLSYTNCCLYPEAPGVNNISNAPLFVDTNTANYRLSSGSPCVNAGINRGWMTDAVDLDGGKRVFNRIVDIGAYEYFFSGTFFYFH